VDHPPVALFLLIIDIAINPTAGFPLQIRSYENFIIDVDPGIRFLRLSHAAKERPELLTGITQYSRDEYTEVATVLTTACGYRDPITALKKIASSEESVGGLMRFPFVRVTRV
jgi:hypothetical protein